MNNPGKHIRRLLFLLTASIFLCTLSCKTIKPVATSPLILKTAQELAQRSDSNEFKSEWVNAKFTATVESKDKSNSFNVNLRMRKDSAIWMSISPALGIEAARILVTKDSIRLMDRINSKYLISNYTALNDLLQVFVDLDMVQSLLVGNNFSYLDDKKFRSSAIDGNRYVLSTLGKRKLKKAIDDKEINKRINQDVWLEPDHFRVAKLQIQDKKANKKLIAQYKDFHDVEGQKFPFSVTFDVESTKTVHITIEYSKVVINKVQDFPFTIPEKYEKMTYEKL